MNINRNIIGSDSFVGGSKAETKAALHAAVEMIAEGAAERESNRIMPFDIVNRLKKQRVGALRLSVEDGGAGFTMRELFEFVIDLAGADSNIAHIFRNHFSITEFILRYKHDEGRRFWLKKIADGQIFSLASGERGTRNTGGGTGFSTSLVQTPDGLRLDGEKYYCTGTIFADWMQVNASAAYGDVVAFVPTGRQGVTTIDDWDGMGQRLTGSGTTKFENVHVEPLELVSHPTGPGKTLITTSKMYHVYLTAVIVGILEGGLKESVTYLKGRKRTFSNAASMKPVEDPLLQALIGQISSTAAAARAMIFEAVDALADIQEAYISGVPTAELVHLSLFKADQAKVFVDSAVVEATSKLMDVGGASGAMRSRNMDRHWRNAKTISLHNPALYRARGVGSYLINGEPLPGAMIDG